MDARIEEVLNFWFSDDPVEEELPTGQTLWFTASSVADQYIRRRFGAWIDEALDGGMSDWESQPRGLLALFLLIVEFPRRIYRDSAQAFAGESRALALCYDGLDDDIDKGLRIVERIFFYCPALRAEDADAQVASVEVYEELMEISTPQTETVCREALRIARARRDVFERFERFPERNHILNRSSTNDESAYLQHSGRL